MELEIILKKPLLSIIAGVLLLTSIIAIPMSIKVVDVTEFPYKYNRLSGEMTDYWNSDSTKFKSGIIWTIPFIETVHTIETLPKRVCLGSGNTKVLNCKVLQFNPKGWRTFVEWHGRSDYNHDNTKNPSSYSLDNILLTYAYTDESHKYKFLNILKETNE